MALPNISFNYGKGGLGRALAGKDHYSGIMFVNSSLPSGFNSSTRIKKIFSLQDAITLGINNLYTDETQATSTLLVTNKGAVGEVVNITYTDCFGVVTSLCSYTLATADIATTTTSATAVKNAINALTSVHGFTATSSTATVTITTRKGEGIYPNSGTPYAYSVSTGATFAGTLTQAVVSGVASKRIIEYYHISEYFRLNDKGVLYVAYYDTYSASNVELVRDFANGEIRQLAVMNDLSTSFSTSQVTALQTQADNAQAVYKPLSIIYAPEISGTASLSSLVDLTGLASKNVSVVISQDGGSFGYKLWKTTNKSISDLGAKLGVVSLAKVNESIAWVGAYNMSDGTELNVVAFSNGVAYSSCSASLLDSLNTYGYMFLRVFVDETGTYNTPPTTCTLPSSDYHFIYSNRTIDKAMRNVRQSLLPNLSSPITLNSDGTMTDWVVAYLESQAGLNLAIMVRDGELSNYAVTIDPAQDVLGTNTINVTVALLPIGVADYIVVNIGFVKTL